MAGTRTRAAWLLLLTLARVGCGPSKQAALAWKRAVAEARNSTELEIRTARRRVELAAPRPPARYALLLNGRLPAYGLSATASLNEHAGVERTSVFVIQFAARSHVRLLVEPNADAGVDVFVHTWNPEAAALVDAQYGEHLKLSLHQPTEMTKSLDKAFSHALSIGRGALLIRHWEQTARGGAPYDLVLAVRYDFVVGAPLRFERLQTGKITLAASCCFAPAESPGERADFNRTCQGRTVSKAGLSPWSRAFMSPCSADKAMPDTPYTRANLGVRRAYFVMDWWLAGNSADLASWAEIQGDRKAYDCATSALGLKRVWGHYLWPLHIHEALGATARLVFSSELTGNIARQAMRGDPRKAKAHLLAEAPGALSVGHCLSLVHRGTELDAATLLASPPESEREAALAGVPLRFAPVARMCPALISRAAAAWRVPCCSHRGACGDQPNPARLCAAGISEQATFASLEPTSPPMVLEAAASTAFAPSWPPSAAHARGVSAATVLPALLCAQLAERARVGRPGFGMLGCTSQRLRGAG